MNKVGTVPEMLIYGVIGASFWDDDAVSATEFVREFKELEKTNDTINIRINSPGGSVWEGLPIINAILESKATVNTYNDGIAYSMGAMILQAGKTRYAAKNSLTLMHAPLNWMFGNAKQFRKGADELDVYANALANTVADKSGLTVEEVMNTFFDGEDHLYGSAKALELNLIDEITPYEGVVPPGAEDLNMKQVFNFFNESTLLKEKPKKKGFGEMVLNAVFGIKTDDMAVNTEQTNVVNEFLQAVQDGTATVEMQDMANAALNALGVTVPLNLVQAGEPAPEPVVPVATTEPVATTDPEPVAQVDDASASVDVPVNSLVALFGDDAKAEDFDLVQVIKDLQASAQMPRRVSAEPTPDDEPMNARDVFAQMEHHKAADKILRNKI